MREKMREKLMLLAHGLERTGVRANFRGSHVEILQPINGGYVVGDIVPWQADEEVPVLYFVLYLETPEGEVRPATAAQFHQAVKSGNKAWVSATEHPLTGLPCLFVHPCHTREWLGDTGGSLMLWLQHFGPAAGLRFVV